MSLFCATCDERFSADDVVKNGKKFVCSICGSEMQLIPSSSSTIGVSQTIHSSQNSLERMEGLLNPSSIGEQLAANLTDFSQQPLEQAPAQRFDEEAIFHNLETILGSEWRESLLQLLMGDERARAQKQLSPTVANTLGTLTVDPKLCILRDVSLHVGPLTVSCIPASFSWMPADQNTVEIQAKTLTYLSHDMWAEESTERQCFPEVNSSFLVCKRGKISFARKANNYKSCLALFVTQPSEYKWPFQATDSAEEMASLNPDHHLQSTMPVLTVRESDMQVVLQYLSKIPNCSIKLRFGDTVSDCSICQENFNTGDQVLKLPCRHLFHGDCVKDWLQTKTTCPLCRSALPDKAEEEENKRTQQEQEARHTMYT